MCWRSNPARSNASMAARALTESPTVPTTRFVGYGMKFLRSALTAFIGMTPVKRFVKSTAPWTS
jgi:hypothetical protein